MSLVLRAKYVNVTCDCAYLSLKVVLQMALDLIAVTGGQAMSIGSQLVEEGLARNLTGN